VRARKLAIFTKGSQPPGPGSATACVRDREGSPLTRLRRALAGGDLLAARLAATDLQHVGLEEAVGLLLIAREDPERLDAAAVRFLSAHRM
jgi:hypothetical protein